MMLNDYGHKKLLWCLKAFKQYILNIADEYMYSINEKYDDKYLNKMQKSFFF